MNKEVISDKQGIFIIAIFIRGTSTILTMGLEAKNDLWLATLLAIFMTIPVIFIYARLHELFPKKDLFDILVSCFGKVIGKGIGICYVWFILHLSSIILVNIGKFITGTVLRETPEIIPLILCSILAAWIVKEGIEVMGRWSEYFLPILLLFAYTSMLFMIPKMEIKNIYPVLTNGMKPVICGAFSAFSFPFAETVVFTMIFSNLKWKRSSYKVYLLGLLLGGASIFLISTMNLLVLGIDSVSGLYFTTYETARRLSVGDVFQRLEMIAVVMFIIGAFLKFSVCLLATSRGISKICGFKDYRFIVVPIALLSLNFPRFLHENMIDLIEWNKSTWRYYAFLFQVILPVILLIVAEIKNRYKKIKLVKKSGIF